MPKISVVCVTNRKGAVEFLKRELDKQTFKDFEVIIADDSGDEQLYEQQFKPRQRAEGDVWNLNKAYNDVLGRVRGQLVIFVQDYIRLPANGLERFWEIYQIYPGDLVSGCGHKYTNGNITEVDDRVFGDRRLVPSDWTFYELNWASCPRDSLVRFDESMDSHYGGENQVFALNATKKGAQVWLDRTNECWGEVHGDRPANWEEFHSNKGFLNDYIIRHHKA